MPAERSLDCGLRPSGGPAGVVPSSAPRSADEDDRRLLSLVGRGDRSAFEVLYRSYAGRLGSYLRRMLREHDRVEECFDDVMLIVWKKAGYFDPTKRVSTWLFGIAHNKALQRLERDRRCRERLASVPPTGDRGEPQSSSSSPEVEVLQRGQLAQLLEAIDRLPDEQREVVELTFGQNYSYKEIAEIVGAPVNTIKTRMFHARRRLRREVEVSSGEAEVDR